LAQGAILNVRVCVSRCSQMSKPPVMQSNEASKDGSAAADIGETEPLFPKLAVREGRRRPVYSSCDSDEWDDGESEESAFSRMQLHATVTDTYAVCSGLITGFCVCTIFINHDDIDHNVRKNPLRYDALLAHQILVRICTALGVYATLVFMLYAMYIRSALARKRYSTELADYFKQRTKKARETAFYAMYSSCVLYLLSIPCGLFYSIHSKGAGVTAVVGLVAVAFVFWECQNIINNARTIFMVDEDVEKSLKKKGFAAER